MHDTMNDHPGGQDPEPRVTMLKVNGAYFLAEGAEFIDAVLTGEGFFPSPVRCLIFEDAAEMNRVVGLTVALGDYWNINPAIVERLRSNEQLVEIKPKAA